MIRPFDLTSARGSPWSSANEIFLAPWGSALSEEEELPKEKLLLGLRAQTILLDDILLSDPRSTA